MADTTAKSLLKEPIQISVRFESELLRRLKDSAKRSLRSVNAEINHRVRTSFEGLSQDPEAA